MLDYVFENLCQHWTLYSKQSFKNCNRMGGRKHVVPPNCFLPVDVGSFKQSLTCHSSILVEITEVLFRGADRAASFEKDSANEKISNKGSNKNVLKSRRWKLLSNSCRARK